MLRMTGVKCKLLVEQVCFKSTFEVGKGIGKSDVKRKLFQILGAT